MLSARKPCQKQESPTEGWGGTKTRHVHPPSIFHMFPTKHALNKSVVIASRMYIVKREPFLLQVHLFIDCPKEHLHASNFLMLLEPNAQPDMIGIPMALQSLAFTTVLQIDEPHSLRTSFRTQSLTMNRCCSLGFQRGACCEPWIRFLQSTGHSVYNTLVCHKGWIFLRAGPRNLLQKREDRPVLRMTAT